MYPIELLLLTMWVELSLSGLFGLLGRHALQIESVDSVVRNIGLEMAQYWLLSLKWPHTFEGFGNYSNVEVIS